MDKLKSLLESLRKQIKLPGNISSKGIGFFRNVFDNVGPFLKSAKSINFKEMRFGDYPKEYNPGVHGPYDPARWYGKPDTPLSQVKLNELGQWFARREKTPQALMGSFSRGYWKWQHKYWHPKRATAAPVFQFLVASMTFFYCINYDRITQHKFYKYH